MANHCCTNRTSDIVKRLCNSVQLHLSPTRSAQLLVPPNRLSIGGRHVCQTNLVSSISSLQFFRRTMWSRPPAKVRNTGCHNTKPLVAGARYVSLYSSNTERMRPPITPENILQFPGPNINIPPDLPVHQMIFDACDKFKEKHAVEDFVTGRKYTYSELKAAIVRVASALYRKGYRKGDVLLSFAVNTVDFTVLLVACAALGVWFSAANPSFTADELARQISHCKAKGVCASASLADTVRDALTNSGFPNTVEDLFVFGEATGFQPIQQLLEDDGKSFPDTDLNPQTDVCVLPYSSGTTGLPKGVMLSHHNCVANASQIFSVLATEPDDNCIGLLPLYHSFGMVVVQFAVLLGGSSIFYLPQFEPETFLRCMQDCKINVAHLVPPVILFLTKYENVFNYDVSSLKCVISGAAPMGAELTKELMEVHPNVEYVIQGFGLTELSPVSNFDISRTPGAVGPMMPNTYGKVVDTETGETLGAGQLGEFCVKGPQVMLGYLDNQQATDDMITPDGWLHTGDIASFNEDGVVTIQDRLKELIKYKASQVAPAELEALLLSHPDVQDVAVIGVPDKAAGELPKAFVVKRSNAEISGQQIAKFVEEKVAKSKRLRGGVQFVDEIPKNPSGKILRRILRDKYL